MKNYLVKTGKKLLSTAVMISLCFIIASIFELNPFVCFSILISAIFLLTLIICFCMWIYLPKINKEEKDQYLHKNASVRLLISIIIIWAFITLFSVFLSKLNEIDFYICYSIIFCISTVLPDYMPDNANKC